MVSLYIFEGDCWTEVCLPPIHPGLDDGNRVRVSFLVCLSANHRAWQVTRGHGILLFFEGKEGGGLRARDVSCCDCNGHCSESDLGQVFICRERVKLGGNKRKKARSPSSGESQLWEGKYHADYFTSSDQDIPD